MKRNGLFIVLEGIDGVGKTTQFTALKEHLQRAGYSVVGIQYPQYAEPSSFFVREYLSGKYGTTNEVGPYTASLFYALDRYQSSFKIQQALEEGKIVLCDRFTSSNMVHQGTKFQNEEERRGFFLWLDNLEYQTLRIPRPDITFMMQLPIEIILERLRNKTRSSTHVKKDIHEADAEHIERAHEVSSDVCRLFPKDYTKIDCSSDGKPLTTEAIAQQLWRQVKPLLKFVHKDASASTESVKLEQKNESVNPYIENRDGRLSISDEGYEFLSNIVTNPRGSVYAFTNNMSTVTVAAAMARLSRRADDLRITVLDEFATKMGKDEQLLRRVITAYGDDSVQQLAGVHVVVEKATKLLTKTLEWGRLASYLEKSTRYIYFDKRDEHGRYKFHIPSDLSQDLKVRYIEIMHTIFTHYSDIVRKLTDYVSHHSGTPESDRDGAWRSAVRAQACDAARAVLPAATETTVGIYASGQSIESLVMHLLSEELPEAKIAGQMILQEARKVLPVFLERADKPERGGATTAYRANTRKAVRELAHRYVNRDVNKLYEPVRLDGYWPKNELAIVPDMLYEFSDLPLKELQKQVDQWSYSRKAEIFQAYMGERLNRRQRPGRALEKIHYSWDLICDFGIFCDLQRHRMVDDISWQQITPYLGYDKPPLIGEAGLSDAFDQCFKLSQELYDILLDAGYENEAQYATLLGHRMRWKITYNAREAFHLHELRTSPQGHPAYRQLVLSMHQKLVEVHPLLAEHMKFVNKDEDQELTRLAAERYSQFKMKQLREADRA